MGHKQLLLKFADYPCRQPCKKFRLALCFAWHKCDGPFLLPCDTTCFDYKRVSRNILNQNYKWYKYVQFTRKHCPRTGDVAKELKRLQKKARELREKAVLDPEVCNRCSRNPNKKEV